MTNREGCTPDSVLPALVARPQTRPGSRGLCDPFELSSPWSSLRFEFRWTTSAFLYGRRDLDRVRDIVERRLGRPPENIPGFVGRPRVVLGPPFAYLGGVEGIARAQRLEALHADIAGAGATEVVMARVYRILEGVALARIDAALVLELAEAASLLGVGSEEQVQRGKGRLRELAKELLQTCEELTQTAPALAPLTTKLIDAFMRFDVEVPPELEAFRVKVRLALRGQGVLVREGGRDIVPISFSRAPILTFVCGTIVLELLGLKGEDNVSRQAIYAWTEELLELYVGDVFARRLRPEGEDEVKRGELVRKLLERKRLRRLMEDRRHRKRARALYDLLYPSNRRSS